MRIKFFFLLALLLVPGLAAANNALISFAPSNTVTNENPPCEIPPPANFHVVQRGATWLKFAWDPGNAAIQRRIRVYRASDASLLNTTIVPAGVWEAITEPLPTGTEVFATINSICEDGGQGSNSLMVWDRTLILDLIVTGFTPGNSASCGIFKDQSGNLLNDECAFYADGSITPFKVSNGEFSRQFGVRYNNGHFEVLAGQYGNNGNNGNPPPPIKLYCHTLQNPTCLNTEKYIVKLNISGTPFPIAEFDLREGLTYGVLKCISLVNGCRIDRMGPGPTGRPSDPPSKSFVRERSGGTETFGQAAFASPNPFSDALDISLAQPVLESANVKLFNLSGQVVLQQSLAEGQEQYTISTAALSPGFYLLRVEADGVVQTLKVVKSE